jgi:hypothetical protein
MAQSLAPVAPLLALSLVGASSYPRWVNASTLTVGNDAQPGVWLAPPPPPTWRNDTENIRVTAALNQYLSQTLFKTESGYEGPTTDSRPLRVEWDIAGEMPRAGKDGVACWFAPDSHFSEGEVVIAGGLWPVGIAHMGGHNTLNHSFSYDVARKKWRTIRLPPLTPGRTQGACLRTSLVIISGGDGGTVGSTVMRLSKATTASEWEWDTTLPPLPPNASRITGTAHAIDDRWLVVGLGNHNGPRATKAGALVPYRLDLRVPSQLARWQTLPAYPAHPGKELSVPISAVVGGRWLVFGGQYTFDADSTAMKAWSDIPSDLATTFLFGQRPTGSTIDVRDAYAYDPG